MVFAVNTNAHTNENARVSPLIGVLALQGGFQAHERVLRRLGARVREVRTPGDLDGLRGLVIPGGESTTMSLGVEREGLAEPLRELLAGGGAARRPLLCPRRGAARPACPSSSCSGLGATCAEEYAREASRLGAAAPALPSSAAPFAPAPPSRNRGAPAPRRRPPRRAGRRGAWRRAGRR